MVTLTNWGFESGIITGWGTYFNGPGVSSQLSTTTGVTEGSNAIKLNLYSNPGSGDYHYKTQSITIDKDFSIKFDYYSTADTNFSVSMLIDSTEVYSSVLSSTGQINDTIVDITGFTGTHTFKIGFKCTSSGSSSNSIYLDNIVVIEAVEDCQSTGAIYAGSQYDSSYVNASIYVVEISPTGAHNQLCNVTTPWGDVHNSEVLEYEVLETYSRSITGGTEYYTLYCTFVVYSETTYAIYTECWYTDLGKRYVKTTGSDSALGTTWGVAWLTMGYGFQNIPSGKDLYVEEGLYGGETLSNLDPPQTMKMYIQPEGHTEAQCNVWVSDDTVFADGDFSTGTVSNWSTSGITVIDPFQTITAAGVVNAFSYYAANPGTRNGKLKIFRDDGTNYNFIGESESFSFAGSSPGTLHDYNKCNVTVQAGDIIGIYLDGGYLAVNNVGSNFLVSKSGDITSNSTKASWSTSGTYRTPMKAGVRGFK